MCPLDSPIPQDHSCFKFFLHLRKSLMVKYKTATLCETAAKKHDWNAVAGHGKFRVYFIFNAISVKWNLSEMPEFSAPAEAILINYRNVEVKCYNWWTLAVWRESWWAFHKRYTCLNPPPPHLTIGSIHHSSYAKFNFELIRDFWFSCVHSNISILKSCKMKSEH